MAEDQLEEAVARAIWLRGDAAGRRTDAKWAEYLGWYREGESDQDSSVHYSTIGEAIRIARAAIQAYRKATGEG